jgi:hypothetical protein
MLHLMQKRTLALAALLLAASVAPPARAENPEPIFVVQTAAGKSLRGPLRRLTADWEVRVGSGAAGRRVAGADLVSVRRVGVALPPLPTDEHLVLVNGDRVPVKDLRLDGERLLFRHPDLDGGKETSVPLTAVALYWRAAPERTAVPEVLRRRLAAGPRKRDVVLLRNGDQLAGTLNALDERGVEVEADKKALRAKAGQMAAVALSSDLADAKRPAGLHARVVLTETERSPGGRLTLTAATCEAGTLRGKTVFGATVRVAQSRVAALDVYGGAAVYLSELKPVKYEYFPYLDERWPWSADACVTGRDLRVGGSTYDKGVGMHSRSRLTYRLGGAHRRFEALAGLDDLDGRKGRARLRVLADGKALDLESKGELTREGGPLALRLNVEGVKELTLEVGWGDDGPVQGVVNWADARLLKK